MVVGMGEDPSIGEYERLLLSMKTTARKELILLHPDRSVVPGSTRDWLKVGAPLFLMDYLLSRLCIAQTLGASTLPCGALCKLHSNQRIREPLHHSGCRSAHTETGVVATESWGRRLAKFEAYKRQSAKRNPEVSRNRGRSVAASTTHERFCPIGQTNLREIHWCCSRWWGRSWYFSPG
jgi:hypothetical protein